MEYYMRLLIIFLYLLIAYGSLFPFNFSLTEFSQQYSSLLSTKISGLGDVLANIVLFFPLGFIYALRLRQEETNHKNSQKLVMWSSVFIFALVLQVLQIALPERDQNIVDVFFNMLGFAFSLFSARYINIPNKYYEVKLSYLPIGIALAYVFSELSPFVPTLDFQEIKNGFKPLFVVPSLGILSELFYVFIMWLLVIRLVSFQRSTPFKSLLVLWLAMLIAKVVIYSNNITYVDIFAPIFALLIAFLVKLTTENVTKSIFYLSLCAFTIYSFSYIDTPNISYTSFIPFSSYLMGNVYSAIQTFIFKLFFFGAMIWLSLELSYSMKKTTISLCLLTFFIEIIQIFMPSRTTDFGDVSLVFIAYLLVRHLGDYLANEEEKNIDIHHTVEHKNAQGGPSYHKPKLILFLYLFTTFCFFYISINFLLNIPGVPSNVKELFYKGGSLSDLVFFYVFLHGLGGASFFIANKAIKYKVLEVWKIIGLHCFTLSILFLCIWFSVSGESIRDLVGASTLRQAIYANQTSQHFLMITVKVLGLSLVANIAQFLDLLFRFSALLGLVQIPFTFWLMSFNPSVRGRKLIALIVISAFMLLVCFHIVFTFSITDNLTELILSPFALVLSLVALSFSIALSILLITKKRYLIMISLIVVTALLSWPLSIVVFDQNIVKYGYTFSALDFLIGAGRETPLDNTVLMLRWTLLIFCFQTVMVIGCLLIREWPIFSFIKIKPFKLIKALWILFSLMFLIYLGNRLFGDSMHWQTLSQYLSNKEQVNYAQDNSVVDIHEKLAPGDIYLNEKRMSDLASAMSQAKDFDTIRITKGHYKQAGILKASHVRVVAETGAVIFGKTTSGKGALLIKGDDNYIEGLECHSIYVSDNNGVCVRLEGRGITLNNVYFHHAQGGLLGSKKGGDIRIENSRFEHLGDGAFYHGIYTFKETRLFINNSRFLNNRNGGHEIKSRSSHTEITNSVIASSQSWDSRLIDAPNGGVLIIKNNILIEGPFSENHDLLSWGVEIITHRLEKLIITDNLIIADKSKARLISLKREPSHVMINDNIVVGTISGLPFESNLFFDNRSTLSIPAAPFIPDLQSKY
jgi:VanZ family protein